eukprot:6189872-Pleurochrysis_carterae.AAC.1
MDCVWKEVEKEGVPKTAATESGRKRDSRSKASRWMRCREWRAKPPKTSRTSGVTSCPRRNAWRRSSPTFGYTIICAITRSTSENTYTGQELSAD